MKVSQIARLAVFGHSPTIAIRDFTGDARFRPDTFDAASLHLRINTASLVVESDVNEKDRRQIERAMREEVLQIAKYPEIVFRSSRISVKPIIAGHYRVSIEGGLSLRGVTRNHTFEAQVVVVGEMLRALGEFALLQSHYGIKRVSVAGGALKVRDELKLSFHVLARRDEDKSPPFEQPV